MKSKFVIILAITLVVSGCAVLSDAEVQTHKSNSEIYGTMLKNYIDKDKDMAQVIKDSHFFTLRQWRDVINSGLKKAGVREAHKANGDIYIPMLQAYINEDDNLSSEMRNSHVANLKKWHKFITDKVGE